MAESSSADPGASPSLRLTVSKMSLAWQANGGHHGRHQKNERPLKLTYCLSY